MRKKRGITVKYNKKLNELEAVYLDHKPNVGMILDHLDRDTVSFFGVSFKEELIKRGYDITTFKFSIDKLENSED